VRLRTALLTLIAAGLLAGCNATPAAQPSDTEPASSPPTTRRPTTAPPRRTTPPAITRDGACPYFTQAFAQQTVGQHLSRSTVTTTAPYPGCTLYRPDGDKAIDVRVTAYPTALAAQRKAVTVLGAGANPTDVGDHGTVAIVAAGARLAASKGRYLIVVFINQQSSLQAHDLASAVAAKIH